MTMLRGLNNMTVKDQTNVSDDCFSSLRSYFTDEST